MKRFLIVGFVFAIFILLVSILTSIRVGGGQLPFFWSVVHEFPLIAICFVLIFRLSENTKPRHNVLVKIVACLLYTSPSPRDQRGSRMPSSA